MVDSVVLIIVSILAAAFTYSLVRRSWVEIDAEGTLTVVNPYSKRVARLDTEWESGPKGSLTNYMPMYVKRGTQRVTLWPLNPQHHRYGRPSPDYDDVLRQINQQIGEEK